MRSLLPLVLALFVAFIALAITACGGNTSKPAVLTGTAATGAPLVGKIMAKSRIGALLVAQSNRDGSFRIETGGMVTPILFQATPADGGEVLYSFSEANTGITVNITPLTTLALFQAAEGKPLAEIFENWETQNSLFDEATITQAQKAINKNLAGLFEEQGLDPTSYDFFNEPFKADQTGIDAVLDRIQVVVPRKRTGQIQFQIPSRPSFQFDPNINVSDINLNPGAPGSLLSL